MKRAIIGIFIFLLFCEVAQAEEVWVLCHPDSYVCLRENPRKTSEGFGGAPCGAEMETDGKTKNGFLYVYGLAAECDRGWISSKYVVYSEPKEINREMVIRADGRVAIRKCVNGKITGWLHDGDRVKVLWASDEWAITSRGYMMTEFLAEVPDGV